MKRLSENQIAVLRAHQKSSVTASLIERATVMAEEEEKNKIKYKGHTLELIEFGQDRETGAYEYGVKIDGVIAPGITDTSPELALERAEVQIDSKKVKSAESLEWSNENAVSEIMKALELPEDQKEAIELSIKESPYSDGRDALQLEADGIEYTVIKDEETAENITRDIVKQDLDNEPEIFNPEFIRQHIYISDTDRRLIAQEDADSYVDDIEGDRAVEEAGMKDEYEAEEDEDLKEVMVGKAREKLREEISERVEEGLKDPIEYLVNEQGIYSIEDLMKASFIQIDTAAAAEDAIRTDGWAHFISRYDGNYDTTPGGFVYFRES